MIKLNFNFIRRINPCEIHVCNIVLFFFEKVMKSVRYLWWPKWYQLDKRRRKYLLFWRHWVSQIRRCNRSNLVACNYQLFCHQIRHTDCRIHILGHIPGLPSCRLVRPTDPVRLRIHLRYQTRFHSLVDHHHRRSPNCKCSIPTCLTNYYYLPGFRCCHIQTNHPPCYFVRNLRTRRNQTWFSNAI